jgi:hypothetical protein
MISTDIEICLSEIRKIPCEGKNVFRKGSDFGLPSLESWLLAKRSQIFVNMVMAILCSFLGFQVHPLVFIVYGQTCIITVGKTYSKIRKKQSDISHNIMQTLPELRNGSLPHAVTYN